MLVCAAALLCLAGILGLAEVVRDGVSLVYGPQGSGCRELTDASAADLARALIPVRVLVGGWVIVTGLLIERDLAGALPRGQAGGWPATLLVPVLLAGVQMLFIGTDALTVFFLLLGVWFVAFTAVAGVAMRAVRRRGERVARSLWVHAGWLLLTGMALPVLLLITTTDGAVRSC